VKKKEGCNVNRKEQKKARKKVKEMKFYAPLLQASKLGAD
jgi:hypothetical protein